MPVRNRHAVPPDEWDKHCGYRPAYSAYIYKGEKFSDHAPLVVDYGYAMS